MKIGLATNDWSRSMRNADGSACLGGSGYIRLGQYVASLRKLGHTVEIGILAFNRSSQRLGVSSFNGSVNFDFDVIILQRYMHKLAVDDVIKSVKNGQIILNDVDDWYWGLSPKNAAYTLTDPTKNPNENITHYKNMISSSSGIIASTPFLLERLSRWNNNVAMHQNYVSTSLFNKVTQHDTPKIKIGWMGSTSHRSGDLSILKGYTRKIDQFASWHHTGHIDAPHVPKFWDEIGVGAGNVTRTPFLPPTKLMDGIVFDVGIVPLSDLPFNTAKSWIKGLEYAAAGVPFVASASDEYVRLNSEYGIGLIAKKPKDFIKHLSDLKDFSYRKSLADSCFNKVKELDVSIGASNLVSVIEDLCNAAR